MLALVSGTQQQQNQRTGSASYEHHEAWFLDTCLRLWQDFRRWTTGADKRSFHDETMSLFLRVLEASVLPLGTTKSLPPASSKTAQSLVRCLLGILDRPDLSTANQVQFASLAIRLRSAREEPIAMTSFTGRRRTDSITLIADDFEGGISVVCQDEAKFGALHKDLQVCLTRPYISNGILTDGSQRYVCGQLQVRGLWQLRKRARSSVSMSLRASPIPSFLTKPNQS